MNLRTTHEMRTQKLELQIRTSQEKWDSLGYFRTVGAARRAAAKVVGAQYRILGDDEVKESW
jgi:hypothetical protein